MVEVFKTNVTEQHNATAIISLLAVHLPGCAINFDLQDCDKILRVKGEAIPVEQVIELVSNHGFDCAVLN